MEIKIYIKQGNSYVERVVRNNNNVDKKFFKSLSLTIEEQLEIIRQHITSFFPLGNVNLKRPYHFDSEINKKLKLLVNIRKINLIAKEKIREITQESDYIICVCGSKMYKIPLNVSYKKFGKNYLLLSPSYGIRYQYSCETCYRAIGEEYYTFIQNNKNRREKLLKDGYNWVPTNFGTWYWEGKGDKKHIDSI